MPLPYEELLRRAIEVCSKLNLSYMAENDDFDPDAKDESAFAFQVERFLVFTQTDGNEDGWVDFYADAASVEGKITQCASDEWGMSGIYDLESDQYMKPVMWEATAKLILGQQHESENDDGQESQQERTQA